MTALHQFRLVALLEGSSYLLLLFVAMPLKYLAGLPLAVRLVGSLHGLLFLLFMVALARVARQRRWPLRRTAGRVRVLDYPVRDIRLRSVAAAGNRVRLAIPAGCRKVTSKAGQGLTDRSRRRRSNRRCGSPAALAGRDPRAFSESARRSRDAARRTGRPHGPGPPSNRGPETCGRQSPKRRCRCRGCLNRARRAWRRDRPAAGSTSLRPLCAAPMIAVRPSLLAWFGSSPRSSSIRTASRFSFTDRS